MERLSAMINDGLRRTSVKCEKMEKQLFSIGKVIDHYMERETPRKKYICEVLLAIPMVMILHQWCLVAPYSTYRIFNLVLFLLWVFVSLVMIGTMHLNIRTRLRIYLWIIVDIIMAWLTLVNYWTYQETGYDMCQEVNIILWTDITNEYLLPVKITILARYLYLWIRIADFGRFDTFDGFSQSLVYIPVVVTLLPDILCLVNVFPTFMSEFSYWLHITIFTAVVFIESVMAFDTDLKITRMKIDELSVMARDDEDDENKNRYIAKANSLNHILQERQAGNMDFFRTGIIPGQWFMRDTLSVCAVCYFGGAVITEFVISEKAGHDIINAQFIVSVLGSWCTSVVTLGLFSALLTCIANICIGCGIFFLTTEVHIAEVMNLNAGGVTYVTTLLLFSESNLLNLAYSEKANAMAIIVMLSFYIVISQTLEVIERKVLSIVNTGTAQDTSLYLRFGILIGMFMIVPTLTTHQVSLHLHTDFLSLFFGASNCNLMVWSIFLIFECSLASLKWRIIQYRNKVEDIIQYCRYAKSFLLIIACILQAYFRFVCPFFQAWWFYRLLLISLGAITSIGIISYSQWLIYKKRKELLVTMNNLADVNYEMVDNAEEGHDCSICYSELTHGKVLPCAHTFHRDCLQHWFQVRQVCPICNTKV